MKFLGVVVILFLGVYLSFPTGTKRPHPSTASELELGLRLGLGLPFTVTATVEANETGRQGFLTTFTMLARDSFKVTQIWWMMINVFFG